MEADKVDVKLDQIIEILTRIEQRQITVREEIKEGAAPVIGSFGTIDTEKK